LQALLNYRRHTTRLLVVDSNPQTVQQVRGQLAEPDYIIDSAELGELAWSKIECEPPHVVICAQRLPDISGLALCQRIKANPQMPDLQVVHFLLLLNSPDPEAQSLALTAGVDSWLVQPLDLLDLQIKVKVGSQLCMTRTALSWTNQRLLTLRNLLSQLGLLDIGVGSLNRQALMESMPTALAEAIARQTQIGCLRIDVDNFDQLHTTYGAKVMEEVLRAVSGRLNNNCDPQSLIYRWDIDSFVCLTPIEDMALVPLAQRLLNVITRHPISVAYGLLLPLTVSIAGIVTRSVNHPENCMNSILQELDQLIKDIKNAGGNQIKVLHSA
jgi:diguanylate cyclase (GGDEF)-like protein